MTIATSFQFADRDVMALLADVMRQWHSDLARAGVRVGVLMATNTTGPAVKHGGYPALATIKPVALKDRVGKKYEAELLIDQREWDDFEDAHREALLDHELSHLALIALPPAELKNARSNDPEAPWWKLDDLGRPRLRSVPGDWSAGDGFLTVCERHGDFAIELLNLTRCYGRARSAAGKPGPGGHASGIEREAAVT